MKTESISIESKHHSNEDRLLVLDMGERGIVAVLADGMGGLSLGDKAAEVVVQSVTDYIKKNYQGSDEKDILLRALEYADKGLREVSQAYKSYMGAAVAVVIADKQHLYCMWQGNVRVYLRHEASLHLVTEDHIAHIGYGRTALTRCIKGAGLREDVPFISLKMEQDDVIYVCTDGLYSLAESDLLSSSICKIKDIIGTPEDDASLIIIS